MSSSPSVFVLAVMVASLGSVGCPDPEVTRMVDGRIERGHFISPAAYALYARATLSEAEGDVAGALRGFTWAASQDPDGPDAWTHIAALQCRAAPPGPMPAAAEAAFDRARSADAAYAPLYRERARCLLTRGSNGEALSDAARALALDPDELDTALVYADALARAGRLEDARLALRAIAVRHTTSSAPWRALEELGRQHGDAALMRQAEERLASFDSTRVGPTTAAGVDAALRGGDLREAQRRALRAQVGDADLAVRAAALGLAGLAREQAELVIAADPADASARIALAAAADLRGDEATLAGALRAVPARTTPPSRLARWLFAEVLQRRVGKEAALAWLGPSITQGAPLAGDPLADATEKRVRAELGSALSRGMGVSPIVHQP